MRNEEPTAEEECGFIGNQMLKFMGDWDEWVKVYNQLPVVTRAALAHLHGRHEDPTMYCPLCKDAPDSKV